jgi:hypothetical protein
LPPNQRDREKNKTSLTLFSPLSCPPFTIVRQGMIHVE